MIDFCGGKGAGKDFSLDLLNLRHLWDVKVEMELEFRSQFETSDKI